MSRMVFMGFNWPVTRMRYWVSLYRGSYHSYGFQDYYDSYSSCGFHLQFWLALIVWVSGSSWLVFIPGLHILLTRISSLGFKRLLTRMDIMGFKPHLTRSIWVGFTPSLTRILWVGFNWYVTRYSPMGFINALTRMNLMGFKTQSDSYPQDGF